VVEGTGLENRQTCKRFEGSNPSPSAILLRATRFAGLAEPLAPRQDAPEVLAKEGIASGSPQAHAIHTIRPGSSSYFKGGSGSGWTIAA
jgi:hypothetical protein